MTDRDHFAAAALTGWLASQQTVISARAMASHAYEYADAILAARGEQPAAPAADARTDGDTTDHGAAPAAKASGRDSSSEAGTGDTRAAQEPVAWAAYVNEADEEPLVLCFKEHRARDEVRGVLGSRVVALYAAPPAAGVTLTDWEKHALARALRLLRERYYGTGRIKDPEQIGAAIEGLLARAAKEGWR